MEILWQEVRHGIRMKHRNLGFTAFVLLTRSRARGSIAFVSHSGLSRGENWSFFKKSVTFCAQHGLASIDKARSNSCQ
jgi:hypothetical protein